MGVVDYIMKPYNKPEFMERIKTAIEKYKNEK
jgi:FixJ family two-component response regulator